VFSPLKPMSCIFTTHLNLVLYCFSIPRKGENKEEEKKEKKKRQSEGRIDFVA